MRFTIRGSRSKGFILSDETGTELGKMTYPAWFSGKAEIYLYNHDHYRIAPSGFMQVGCDILHAEYKTGEIKWNWRGNISITLNGQSYLYKRASFWGQKFALHMNGQEIAQISQRYEWSKLGFLYEIEVSAEFKSTEIPLLTLLMVFCTNRQYAGAGAT